MMIDRYTADKEYFGIVRCNVCGERLRADFKLLLEHNKKCKEHNE